MPLTKGTNMPTNKGNKHPKLENYLIYGMIFGLLAGSLLGTFAMIAGHVFIAIGSYGAGVSLGMLIGTLLYTIKKRSSKI